MSDNIGEVGIWWLYKGALIRSSVPITKGEEYGDFLNGHTDHYNFWDQVLRTNPDLLGYDYVDIPRGRVVYNKKTNTFIIYTSAMLVKNRNLRSLVLKNFNLDSNNTKFKQEDHYEDPYATFQRQAGLEV